MFTAERFDRDHAALAVLLGLNGLRVSEACGTNIEHLGFQRGHRTLRILGKGNKICNECVGLCNEIIKGERAPSR